jgi:hypothetical protein
MAPHVSSDFDDDMDVVGDADEHPEIQSLEELIAIAVGQSHQIHPDDAVRDAVFEILDNITPSTHEVVLQAVSEMLSIQSMGVVVHVLVWLRGGDNVYDAETFVTEAGGDPAVVENMPTGDSSIWMFAHRLHITTSALVLISAMRLGDLEMMARVINMCPPTYDTDIVNGIVAVSKDKHAISWVYEVAKEKGTPFAWDASACEIAQDKETQEVYEWIHSLPGNEQPCGGVCNHVDVDE